VGEVSDHQGFHGSSPKLNQVVGWVVSFIVGLDLSIAGAVPPAVPPSSRVARKGATN
jgi:hypothetical protein